MSKIITRLLPLLMLVQFCAGGVNAQQIDRAPNLKLGDAVVTGFSGTIPPDIAQAHPASKSAIDHTFIDPDGPSARVIGLAHPGYIWDGRLFDAPKTFDVLAKDVGQVFGVALDDANPPNIYLAATSVFGLNIVRRGRDGRPQRLKEGRPGAGWMRGQFGLDLQGGPGAIYKVDGRTGAVTLFANVTLDGVPNPAPGLGNLAYDPAHKQLFVSDLYTGMIHRFDLEGRDLGHYDHGVGALAAANIAQVPFDAHNRPNIASARFNSEKPDSWGYAPPARQVWGLAVHDGRLYYAVAAGPQVWSVGMTPDGGFANDPRLEVDVPAQGAVLPVTDIAFSPQGAMLLAQRASIAGAYDYSAFTKSGEPRVLRFSLKTPNDPPSPGRWKPEPEEYAVGFAGDYRNTDGGIALGYGYDRNGTLDTGACDAALWTTGQNLRNNPAMRSQLEPGGPLDVNGLQGSPTDLVRGANTPPTVSYFIDYDGKFDDARASGHMGSVRILTKPCEGSVRPIAAFAPIATPIGGHGRACTPTCICPPGTVRQGKDCVNPKPCPDGQVINPLTGACGCPPRYRLIDGVCKPEFFSPPTQSCKPPMVQIIGGPCVCPSPLLPGELPGTCKCPDGSVPVNGQCGPPKCDPPLVPGPQGTCICPQGSALQDGKCVPQICPPPLVAGPCVDGTPIDLGVVKTGDTSPPVDVPWYGFHITVTNYGPASAAAGTITVTDVVPNGMTFTNVIGSNWSCNPTSGGPGTPITCTYTLATNAGDVLPTIDITAQAIGNGPFPPFTNCAVVSPASGSGYVDTDSSDDKWCVTVGKPGSLTVTKTLTDKTEKPLPPNFQFPITVTCTPSSTTATFNLTANGSYTMTNIPFGDTCTVSETLPPLPANICPRGTVPAWSPLPSYSPSNSALINVATQTIDVHNSVICEKKDFGRLSVTKHVASDPRGIANTLAFPVTAMCTNPTANYVMVAHNNTSSLPINVPVGSVCTFAETLPALPTGCTWNMQLYSPTSLPIVSGLNQEFITNAYTCDNTPPVCPSPQVLNVDNICICPSPMVPGATPDTCNCPDGDVLRDGKCVPVTICTPPQVMIPGVGCRCPDDEVLVNGKCVEPIICKPPLMLNADKTACICPDHEVMRNGKCVRVEEPKHHKHHKACKRGYFWNGDMCVKHKTERHEQHRELPSLHIPFGGGGGGGGGGGHGGGAGGGKRGP